LIFSHVWSAPVTNLSATEQGTTGDLPLLEIEETSDGKLLTTGGDAALWMMNADGSQLAPFSNARNANAATPCGHFILFTSEELGTSASSQLIGLACNPPHSLPLICAVLYVRGMASPSSRCRMPAVDSLRQRPRAHQSSFSRFSPGVWNGGSKWYISNPAGRRIPHPRHWQALAQLVGIKDGV